MDHFFLAPKIKTEYLYNADTDETVIKRTEDISGVMDTCAELRATESDRRQYENDDVRLLGYLPGTVIEMWCQHNHVSWQEFMREPQHVRKLLNSPEFANFKTTNGRV